MPLLPDDMKNSSTPSRHPAARPARWLTAVALTGPLWFAGCQSLDVVNQNSPAIEGVFSDAANIEAALVGGWRDWWGTTQGARANATSPILQLSVLGNELTTADAFPMQVTQEPRVAIDNLNQGGWHNRKPWYDMYQVISTGRDVHQSIVTNNLRIGAVTADAPNGADTPRALIFSKFLIGIGNVYLGLLFDQGFPSDETTDLQTYDFRDLRPYQEMLEDGRRTLREAIAEAKAAPDFSLPPTWINGNTLSRDNLVRVMYTYLARSYAYEARDVAGRAATNWQQVLNILDSAITTSQFQQADNTIADTRSVYQQLSYFQTNARASNRLIGPADTTGAYQLWLTTPLDNRDAFILATPDKRFSNVVRSATLPSNVHPAGTRFRRLPNQTMTVVRGTYMRSNYHSFRYQTPPSNIFHSTGLLPWLMTDEIKYLRAEALFRLNRRADVLPLLNPTRVAAGLAPVTVNGPPNNPSCVPRKNNGDCGDLWDAFMYEKRIDLFPYEPAVAFYDARGWGTMISGTPVHFPVHGRELETLGLPVYTIGGGGPGSAP